MGEGTTIKIFLPRAHAVPVHDVVKPSSKSVAPAPETTVMVVDDDDAVRSVTSGILVDLGYVVVEAGSGGAALDVFDRHPDIQAVVLDFAMPGMNGGDVARELTSRRPGLPILFATGYADAEALASTSDDRIIHKPFDQSDLADKLALALG
ncbi:MAG: response regulator [Brevundimonas sp.]